MIKKIVPWLGVIVTLLLLAALMAPRMIGQSNAPHRYVRTQLADVRQMEFVHI